jgi:hypothetical protein
VDQHPFHIGVSFILLIFICSICFCLVIPNRLLASAYPAEKDPTANLIRIQQIIDAGVEVVVNTMELEELKSFTPYQDTMLQIAEEGIYLICSAFQYSHGKLFPNFLEFKKE